MTDLGTIAVRRTNGKNDLYFFGNPHAIAIALLIFPPGTEGRRIFNEKMIEKMTTLKVIHTVNDSELEIIKKAKTNIPNQPGYHKYASDIVHVIDPNNLKDEQTNKGNS